jgi:hypothetical protein
MAAGAIPPPLFFERRRPCERKFCERKSCEQIGSGSAVPQRRFRKTSSVDHVLQ